MKERGFDFDAEYGASYDQIVRQVVPGYDDLYPMVLALMRGALAADARVLVVGVGSGSELLTFAAAEPGWRLTGVEPSSQMIEIATAKLARANLEGRVSVHHGVTEDLPRSVPFDAATLICVLHFVPDDGGKLALLRSIASQLRPGAPLVLVDGHGEPGTPAFDATFDAWMRYILLAGMTEAERATYRAQLEASIRWASEPRLLELLDQAGFDDVLPFYRALVFGGWIARRR